MTIAAGAIVANVYYIQPLLAAVAHDFGLRATGAGYIAGTMQLGTTCAMSLFVPLGDTHERRGLISTLLVALTLALVAVALARNAVWLALAGAVVGASGSVVHLIIPFAAHLAPAKDRGRVVGQVIGGLLLGILLARTLSGWIGSLWGWRAMYWIAAGLMLVLAALTRLILPRSDPELKLTYRELARSIYRLAREQPALRESSFLGATFFCAFSAFWTTLIFLLSSPPYHFRSPEAVTGLFGLVGAVGALGAPLIGRIADQRGPRSTLGLALVAGIASFGILALGGHQLIGLIAGVILLDLAVQAGHVSNQTRIYNLIPSARSRLNTVYMTCYFIGGATGSVVGAWGWHVAHWWGVCATGVLALLAGLGVFWRNRDRTDLSAVPA